VLLVLLAGCRACSLEDDVDGQAFTRCGAVDAPEARVERAGRLALRIEGRTLEVLEPPPTLRIAAFTGPVGSRFGKGELALLARAKADLALYLGGLGDDEGTATDNLRALARVGVPTLFVPGGADRLPLIEAAFAALTPPERALMIDASGLHALRIGSDRFALVAGAALGRYAVAADACGFAARDVEAIRAALGEGAPGERTWLVSWHAPAGFGVGDGPEGSELGSPDLKGLAFALGARGGLFAYPEVQAVRPGRGPLALVVPRLGRAGVVRADGSRVAASVALVARSAEGLRALQFP